jgi:hypothetical protein
MRHVGYEAPKSHCPRPSAVAEGTGNLHSLPAAAESGELQSGCRQSHRATAADDRASASSSAAVQGAVGQLSPRLGRRSVAMSGSTIAS